MQCTLKSKVLLLASTMFLANSFSASADVVNDFLSLTNAATGTSAYTFSFTQNDPDAANNTTATIIFGGYQLPSWEFVTDISVTQAGGGANLLGSAWAFTAAAQGSFATTFNDGTSVPALQFGGQATGYYDTFTQVIQTTPGATYNLSFFYSNNPYGGANENAGGFTVVEHSDGQTAVPELSTWALMLLGFVGLGFAGQRRNENVRAVA